MDGERLFAFLLWELPGERTFDRGLRGIEPLEFIQCAGSVDTLTVEVRERDGDGYVLSTLGRSDEEPGPKDVAVTWRASSVQVHRNEHWDADGAADLFLAYWRGGGSLPDGVGRRFIESFER